MQEDRALLFVHLMREGGKRFRLFLNCYVKLDKQTCIYKLITKTIFNLYFYNSKIL